MRIRSLLAGVGALVACAEASRPAVLGQPGREPLGIPDVEGTGRPFLLATRSDSLCLDAWLTGTAPRSQVVTNACDGGVGQTFAWQSSGEIRSNGLCLDAGRAPGDGAVPLVTAACDGGESQRWRAARADAIAMTDGRCLDVASQGRATGAPVVIQDCDGGANQQWDQYAANEPEPPPVPPPAGGSCGLVTDKVAHSEQTLAKPGYLQSVIDPAFKTKITRIGGDPGTPIPTVGGTWGQLAKQNYPKDPAWSADQSLIVLKYAIAGRWLFLDGNTYQVKFARASPGVEARWHPTLPDVMVYVTSSGAVGQWNVRTPSTSLKVAPSGYSQANLGPYEGNLSRDGKWVVVAATRGDGRKVAYPVDIDAGMKGADIDLAANGVAKLDWASISALGNYVVLNGTIDGVQMSTKVLTRSGTLVSRWPEQSRPSHFDLTTDVSGVEVGVGGVGGSPNEKTFIMRRLDDGAVTVLAAGSYDYHSSARNVRRPGWAYHVQNVSSDDGVFVREMFATKLDGSGAVERFGHHRSRITDYDTYPMAVPSPDGKRIMFASNWGSASRPVQAYVIDTRDICP